MHTASEPAFYSASNNSQIQTASSPSSSMSNQTQTAPNMFPQSAAPLMAAPVVQLQALPLGVGMQPPMFQQTGSPQSPSPMPMPHAQSQSPHFQLTHTGVAVAAAPNAYAAGYDNSASGSATSTSTAAAAPSAKSTEAKNPADVKMSVRVLVDSALAGRVIGKSGETVKKMRDSSGAFIDIANSVRGATRRIITVKGTSEPIISALCQMAESLASREDGTAANGKEKKDNFKGKSDKSDNEKTDEDFESTHSLVLLVHNAQVGCIIGRGGATVRETRETSGAIINVSENMLEGSMEKTVTVKGNAASVRKALSLMVRQLSERQDRSTSHNLYTPRPAFDSANPSHTSAPGQNATAGYTHATGAPTLAAPTGFAGYSVTMPVAGQPLPMGQQFAVPFAQAQPQPQPAQPAPAAQAPQQTIVVPVPDAMIGCVIGKRGQTVREIRQRSRAQITIADLQPNQSDRMLTVTGTRQTIEMALALIYEKMNSFDPNKRGTAGGAANANAGANAAAPAAGSFAKAAEH